MKGLFLEKGHLDVCCLKNSRIKINLIKKLLFIKGDQTLWKNAIFM